MKYTLDEVMEHNILIKGFYVAFNGFVEKGETPRIFIAEIIKEPAWNHTTQWLTQNIYIKVLFYITDNHIMKWKSPYKMFHTIYDGDFLFYDIFEEILIMYPEILNPTGVIR